MSKLDLLGPYLQHREVCDKWRSGVWDNQQECTCGLEDALIVIADSLIEEMG